jgi:hypothetical protein
MRAIILRAICLALLFSLHAGLFGQDSVLPPLEVGNGLPIEWLKQFKDEGLMQWVKAHVVCRRQSLPDEKYGISATDQLMITPEVFNGPGLNDNQRISLLAFELGKVFYKQKIEGNPSRMGLASSLGAALPKGHLASSLGLAPSSGTDVVGDMKNAEYLTVNLPELGDSDKESHFGYVFRVALLKIPGNANWAETLKNFRAIVDPVIKVDRAMRESGEDVLGSIPYGAVESREKIQAEWTDYENWLRRLKETLAREEAVRRQEREQTEFQQALYRYVSAFGYLTAAAGMACDNPNALLAEVRQGGYSDVSMDRKYLTAYLGMVSPGNGVSPCQFQILNKINDSEIPVSWRDLEAWGSQYRAKHPTFLQRTCRELGGFRDSFRHFAASLMPGLPSGSGGSHTQNQGGTDHSRHAPDVMGTSSARQLRGIASGGWH